MVLSTIAVSDNERNVGKQLQKNLQIRNYFINKNTIKKYTREKILQEKYLGDSVTLPLVLLSLEYKGKPSQSFRQFVNSLGWGGNPKKRPSSRD